MKSRELSRTLAALPKNVNEFDFLSHFSKKG